MNIEVEDPFLSINNLSKQCRICFQGDNADDMISPCLCSGTMAYVHRKCLNDWRLKNIHNTNFKNCYACIFEYVIEHVVYDHKTEYERYFKYFFLVIRDSTQFILSVQSIIMGFAFFMKITYENVNKNNTIHQNSNLSAIFMYYYFGALLILSIIIADFHLYKNFHALSGFNANIDNHTEKVIEAILICIFLLARGVVGLFIGIYHTAMIIDGIMIRHKNKLWLRQETDISFIKDFQGRKHELEKYSHILS